MTRFRLKFSARAAAQIERAARWWRKHRDKAPTAFDNDLDAALALIRSNPSIGEPVTCRRRDVRRYWIERIGYFLYYSEPMDGAIEILAVWHAARGSRPRL